MAASNGAVGSLTVEMTVKRPPDLRNAPTEGTLLGTAGITDAQLLEADAGVKNGHPVQHRKNPVPSPTSRRKEQSAPAIQSVTETKTSSPKEGHWHGFRKWLENLSPLWTTHHKPSGQSLDPYMEKLYEGPTSAVLDKLWLVVQAGGGGYVTLSGQFKGVMIEQLDFVVTTIAMFTGFGRDILLGWDMRRKAKKALHTIATEVSLRHLDTGTATEQMVKVDSALRERGARHEPVYEPMKHTAEVLINHIALSLQEGKINIPTAEFQFGKLRGILTPQCEDELRDNISEMNRLLQKIPD